MLNLPAAELRIEATRSGMPHVKGQGTAATTLLHKHQVTSGLPSALRLVLLPALRLTGSAV